MATSPAMVGGGSTLERVQRRDGSSGIAGIVSVSVDKAVNRIPVARSWSRTATCRKRIFPQRRRLFQAGRCDQSAPGTVQRRDAFRGHRRQAQHQDLEQQFFAPGRGVPRQGRGDNARGPQEPNYVDKKDSDIISALIGNCSGLSADVNRPRPRSTKNWCSTTAPTGTS